MSLGAMMDSSWNGTDKILSIVVLAIAASIVIGLIIIISETV